ncbi:hypothetical protein MXD62_01800 [Frankia sp. Mgl5]|uniref:Uncharacterized protein n=1 Tax=Parafrankia soli TaxID=2599596 RepID=A0A1S1RI68_9ACTN|nr:MULTISPECIES: hypothetical protein [Frankiaceae]MCK9925905.1 hypothetical protein [Frankia sp. Mgl5]OHV45519.1 hypothetical protein BBK14_30290 [Parafrankia soli]CAI7974087.1 conserved hypothetical protein [Frankia sp. Hr75.2]
MTIFEALTTGLNDTDRNLTLDVIRQSFDDGQAAARQGRPHRNVEEITRRRRSAQSSRPTVVGDRTEAARCGA